MQVSSYQQELLGKMSKFMGPATLIPLGDPLMSLCDTVCIGQYFFQNLQVASLSVISSRLREGAQGAAARTLACALLLAAVAGTLTAAGLEASAPWLLQAVGVKDAALLPMAADYMRVRALAQPAVLVTMVAQSGLLAQHDSLTPCISVLLAAAVSLAGNVVFVAGQGWGLTGAAVTTVATQYVAAGALMWSLQRSSSQVGRRERPHDILSAQAMSWLLVTLCGVLSAQAMSWLLVTLCGGECQLWGLLHTMAPLTVVSLSKHLCYLVVQSTATGLHLLSLAAHQAAFTVWWVPRPPAPPAALSYPDPAAMALIALPAALSAGLVGLDVSSTAINITQRDFTYMARSYVAAG
ncbi:multidrug and toxic compound extrusion protein [Haematococcus lacustris]|uniref:Multidrug and toxic compound extrusion protein n=1 Tax=Haematococcus lacustris TaxID=44745 RepID=A0A699ZKG7_HAELA|nr:multidrug and toxic compound extrusion protein [Haematococcus lacustris]